MPHRLGLYYASASRHFWTNHPLISRNYLRQVGETYGINGSDNLHRVQTAESHWYGRKRPLEEDLRRARQTWLHWIFRILRRDS